MTVDEPLECWITQRGTQRLTRCTCGIEVLQSMVASWLVGLQLCSALANEFAPNDLKSA